MVPAGVPQSAETPQRRSERFRRSETLRKTGDYRRCYAEGRRKGGAYLVLHTLPNGTEAPRFGQTASRKVGKAVERHRLKRWAREIYRRWPDRHRLPPADLIAHFKTGAAAASFSDFRRELERLLSGLLTSATGATGASIPPTAPSAARASRPASAPGQRGPG